MRTQKNFGSITRCTGVTLLVLVVWSGTERPAVALECPVPHPTATITAIKQTKTEIVEYSNLIAAQGTRVVPEIIAQLKKRHPGVGDAEITSFLVTIYCPVVNQNADLGDDQKPTKIMAFSSAVLKRLDRP